MQILMVRSRVLLLAFRDAQLAAERDHITSP